MNKVRTSQGQFYTFCRFICNNEEKFFFYFRMRTLSLVKHVAVVSGPVENQGAGLNPSVRRKKNWRGSRQGEYPVEPKIIALSTLHEPFGQWSMGEWDDESEFPASRNTRIDDESRGRRQEGRERAMRKTCQNPFRADSHNPHSITKYRLYRNDVHSHRPQRGTLLTGKWGLGAVSDNKISDKSLYKKL